MSLKAKLILAASLSVFATAGIMAVPSFAADDKAPPAKEAASSFSNAQKAELNKMFADYIHEHPETIIGAIQDFQKNQEEKLEKIGESRISENQAALTGKDLPSTGNPNGDVTVTEFFDYNCGYCKKAIEDIQSVLSSDKNVRFVFKELPILGPTSGVAAQWSMAAEKQGKYYAFHSALMHNNEPRNEDTLEKVAKQAGLDVDKAKKDAESQEIKDAVAKSRDLALQLQITATPGFIINGKFYRGYLGPGGLKTAIEEARKSKKG